MNKGGRYRKAAPDAAASAAAHERRSSVLFERRIGQLAMVVMAAACLTLAGCAARFPSELDVRLSDTRIAPHHDEFATSGSSEGKDYDPWEPVNEQVFSFNHDLV